MISEKAATALATIATVCWCVQLIPQIIYNWKKKGLYGAATTDDVPLGCFRNSICHIFLC